MFSLSTLLFKCPNTRTMSTMPLMFEQLSCTYMEYNNVQGYYDFMAFYWNISSAYLCHEFIYLFFWNSIEVRRPFVAKRLGKLSKCINNYKQTPKLFTNCNIIPHDSVGRMENLLTQEIFLTARTCFQKWAFCFISLINSFGILACSRISPITQKL